MFWIGMAFLCGTIAAGLAGMFIVTYIVHKRQEDRALVQERKDYEESWERFYKYIDEKNKEKKNG